MFVKLLVLTTLLLSGSVFSYSTLDCSSNQKMTYSLHNKVGGARPFQGMIIQLEEITKDNIVVFRKVIREECYQNNCRIQQPELVDVNTLEFPFSFIQSSKQVLSSDGHEAGPVQKSTYAIKFVLKEEIWMLCDSFQALYP